MNKLAVELGPMPRGWFLSGSHPTDYRSGIDATQAHSGSQSASVLNSSDEPDGFATLMQEVSASCFAGKRIRMSGWVKTQEVQVQAALWMSVYGTAGRINVSFDNMCDRTIIGTTEWTQYHIVLDVPIDSVKIGLGVILAGTGQLWFDDVVLEEVSTDFAVTDCPCSERRKEPAADQSPKMPVNLNFEES